MIIVHEELHHHDGYYQHDDVAGLRLYNRLYHPSSSSGTSGRQRQRHNDELNHGIAVAINENSYVDADVDVDATDSNREVEQEYDCSSCLLEFEIEEEEEEDDDGEEEEETKATEVVDSYPPQSTRTTMTMTMTISLEQEHQHQHQHQQQHQHQHQQQYQYQQQGIVLSTTNLASSSSSLSSSLYDYFGKPQRVLLLPPIVEERHVTFTTHQYHTPPLVPNNWDDGTKKNGSRRKRMIQHYIFTIAVQICDIPSLSHYTDIERQQLWYTPEEIQVMRHNFNNSSHNRRKKDRRNRSYVL